MDIKSWTRYPYNNMIKGVIFDFDNTLYDYENANKKALAKLFALIANEFNIDADNIYRRITQQIKSENNSANKFNKAIYMKRLVEVLKLPLSNIRRFLDCYNNAFSECQVLNAGVKELLQYLTSRKIKIAILSNNVFLQQYEKLERMDIVNDIDVLQTSDEVGEEKPCFTAFQSVQQKMGLAFTEMVFIGDCLPHDIYPSMELGMLALHFTPTSTLHEKYVEFHSFSNLTSFFETYFQSVDELLFLSKYFGQSTSNIQGPGGNISIKNENLMFIKSSGAILGNMTYESGYCLVDNCECLQMIDSRTDNIKTTKMFGNGTPSMETYFHSFMKKYTVHLHFTLSNIFLCSNAPTELVVGHNHHKVIDYFIPGLELALEIKKEYEAETDIYFLKNHGVIITADTLEEVLEYYNSIFFSLIQSGISDENRELFGRERIAMELNLQIHNNGGSKVVRPMNISAEAIENRIECFPDMAVFIQTVVKIDAIEDLDTCNVDIIIYENQVYGVADTLTKLYSLQEIVDSYKTIFAENKGNITSILEISRLQNMEQEKNRR